MIRIKDVMVSVFMTVYNHERWVAQAIEGVLNQRTTFHYQLIIGEDCSTDNSRAICIDYKNRYTDKIILLLNERNLGMSANAANVSAHCIGKYVAVCEGDDYWTDPFKLQKQVDFLESHPDYSACYHSVKIIDENGRERTELDIPAYTSTEIFTYPMEDVYKMRLPGQSCSLVSRNMRYFITSDVIKEYDKCLTNGDQKGVVLYLKYGKIFHMGDCMACYRRTYIGDSWNARTYGKEMSFFSYRGFLHMERFANYCLDMQGSSRKYARGILCRFLHDFVNNQKKGKYEALWNFITYDIILFLRFVLWEPLYKKIYSKVVPYLVKSKWKRTSQNKRYYLFGTGTIGKRAFTMMSRCGMKPYIGGFLDNDVNKNGSIFCGKPVSLPCNVRNGEGNVVLITSTKYEKEIREQLVSSGYVYGCDAISWSDWMIWLNDVYLRQNYPWLFRYFLHYQVELR